MWEAARSRRVFILLSGLEPVLTMKARGQTGRSAALHTRIVSHRHPIIPWALGQLQSGTMRDSAQSSSYRDVCESAVESESRYCFLMKKNSVVTLYNKVSLVNEIRQLYSTSTTAFFKSCINFTLRIEFLLTNIDKVWKSFSTTA